MEEEKVEDEVEEEEQEERAALLSEAVAQSAALSEFMRLLQNFRFLSS